jgi:hypothetical protein
MAAEGDPAEGRPEGADAPRNQAREAHHPARPLHSPEGAMSRMRLRRNHYAGQSRTMGA